MDKYLDIALVVVPILFSAALGILARRKDMLAPEEVRGLQQFVIRFGLPCLLFNSCLTAQISSESVSTMIMLIPLAFLAALWGFHARKKLHPYHNLPLLISGKETGMIGIPLFIVLFGAAQSYHMGVLDLAQGVITIPVVSILSAKADENPSPAKIAKQVLTSPMLVCSLLGLVLNLTGVRDFLASFGLMEVITGCTGFLGQPVSAMMLFSAGYNFSMSSQNRKAIWTLSVKHLGLHALFCVIVQLFLCLMPNADPMSRWAVLMYYTLPASYLAPTLGQTEEERAIASSVCSVLTVISLIVFCAMAVLVV